MLLTILEWTILVLTILELAIPELAILELQLVDDQGNSLLFCDTLQHRV
jgi:hypothetical protein